MRVFQAFFQKVEPEFNVSFPAAFVDIYSYLWEHQEAFGKKVFRNTLRIVNEFRLIYFLMDKEEGEILD